MADPISARITTDYAIPPGETLSEFLEERGMSQSDLARRTNRPLKTINEIVKGKAAITPETAIQFERVLGMPDTFWNNLERNYREDRARLDERRELGEQVGWLKQFPIKELIGFGAPIKEAKDKVDQLTELLRFFAVSSPIAWDRQLAVSGAMFRRSAIFAASPPAVAAWLRWGELEADRIECQPFDAEKFRSALKKVKPLTREDPEVFVPAVQRICAEAGVAVVFIPDLPKTRASGVARWLTPTKAMIQLSLYGKSDDKLWFSFFHEAGHLLLHGRKEGYLDSIERTTGGLPDVEEDEANRFARDFLISPSDYQRIASTHNTSTTIIARFAAEIGIAPGIVVGRLQHDGLVPPNYCNKLKRPLQWASEREA
jgi:HTH-type transcriptional regulator/antitoxin HigA